jgi:hypothetical protein
MSLWPLAGAARLLGGDAAGREASAVAVVERGHRGVDQRRRGPAGGQGGAQLVARHAGGRGAELAREQLAQHPLDLGQRRCQPALAQQGWRAWRRPARRCNWRRRWPPVS